MNERIRELAEQAGIVFFNSIDPEFFGREYCEAWTEEQQKFALLIVRKCVNIVEDAVLHREPASIYVGKIKQHFGVE